MREATRAVAIIGITMPVPLVISITMTKDVMGDCVTAARYPVMHSAITAAIGAQAKATCTHCASPAPIDSDGEKRPPGMPAM